jgi:GNAT superfamily N-acetyltransferase
MSIIIREAGLADLGAISAILNEAERWLEERGIPLWNVVDLAADQLRGDVTSRLFVLAEANGRAAGTLKYQLEDPLIWPDVREADSAFLHRMAVRREFAGGTASTALLKWAVDRTKGLGRRYLRLDCDASRPKLRLVYEQFGFQHHSDRHIGQYHVARYQYDVVEGQPNEE